ncbi:alkaline phosphatase family protein [Halobacterium noricense]|uniref:hypothetical protein n=1 Tax=Halobacterium noricense TaxID=223182 RepID=UPI001E336B72|nr:hypothetical protein [Halobacterium noricense]UHH26535.1 hypothetical protein LT974_06245 [Halobacterium noricense]
MTATEWAKQTVGDLRSDGIDGARRAGRQLWKGAFRRLDWFDNGTPIYERDWDVLIVLDACRYDLMEEVYHEYGFLETLESFHSVGSSSSEWMRRNFTEEYREEIERTVHVTGNPNSAESIPVRNFDVFDEVWEYEWDESLGTIRPDAITDRAISLHRAHNPNRMLLHYMQPHHPFVENPLGEGFGATSPWGLLREGKIERNTVWRRYRQNLRYVLESLSVLMRNMDAQNVIITSDHGNLLGEYRMYEHPAKIAVPELRMVPWCETTAEDYSEYEPTLEPPTEIEDNMAESRLKDLGYL